MQGNPTKRLSKHKEEEQAKRGKRAGLIKRAGKGDPAALAELRKEHQITRVWTKEEIEQYGKK